MAPDSPSLKKQTGKRSVASSLLYLATTRKPDLCVAASMLDWNVTQPYGIYKSTAKCAIWLLNVIADKYVTKSSVNDN